ncbi:response regulator transcription factor [Bradyrhizobium sp. RDT10]
MLTAGTIDPRLSPRERSIMRCLIEGDSNKCIARKIEIAEATVKVHIKAILRKIHVQNRTQAAIWGSITRSWQRRPTPAWCPRMRTPAAKFPFFAMAENDRSGSKESNDRGHRILHEWCDDASTVVASARAAGRLAAERGAVQHATPKPTVLRNADRND